MPNKKIGLITLLASIAASEIWAGTITNYAVGDVLICFRKGGNDMVVDAGPLSTFTNAAANFRTNIIQYTGTQLAAVGTNGVSWSAFTWTGDNTLYVSRARTSLNDQSAPWEAKSSSAQSGTALLMATIPLGAQDELSIPFSVLSTPTAVIEEDDSDGNQNYKNGVSYHNALGSGGKFGGTFVGNPENTTAGNFTTSGQVVRSDFYQLQPTSGFALGKYLGYFELAPNGTMTYVAYPTAVPVLSRFARSGNNSTITYKTGIYGTYTLRRTNNLASGTAKTNWPAITILTSGDNATHTTTDTTTDNIRFYTITAQ
jgi:hypothetical protein